jgi:hypothetical protein
LPRPEGPWGQLLLCLAGLALLTCGCVRRRLTVRSDPPGALVYVDDQEIGTTPVSTPFTYYGTRKFRLVKDGYETVTIRQRFQRPWYQWPVVEFVAENLVPREIRDERMVDFQLQPQRIVPMEELLDRADELRTGTRETQPVSPSLPAVPESGTPVPGSPEPILPAPARGPAPEPLPGPGVPAATRSGATRLRR